MLRILAKSGKVQAVEAGSGSDMEEYDVVEDLSSWEFVNQSDDEDDDRFSFNEDDLDNEDGHDEIVMKLEDEFLLGSPSSDVSMESVSPPQISSPLDVPSVGLNHDYRYNYDYDHDYTNSYDYEDEEEDEEDDGGYDLDDELVPRWVSDKLGRQRIRKMGKRASPRMNKAKGLPYYFHKPGSVPSKLR